jgi:hypothetical protein
LGASFHPMPEETVSLHRFRRPIPKPIRIRKYDRPGWVRIVAGQYELPGTGYEITRETDDSGVEFWACRANGCIFDRAETLKEAKSYCQ